jgi:hypothetical protein
LENTQGEKMNNYLLLYSGGKMPATEMERQSVTADWMLWLNKWSNNVVDQGNPFTTIAKHITSDGRINDGPIGTVPSGYTVIKANSMDEALRIAQGCPVLKGGATLAVYETFNAMG